MSVTGSIANGLSELAVSEPELPEGLGLPATATATEADDDVWTDPSQGAPQVKSVDGSEVTSDLFSNSAGSVSDSNSKEHKLGLDINFPWGWAGSKYNDYDLITVHGIRDDYKTSWIDKDGRWWAKDVLFKDLSIREVDYSYEIDQDSMLYEPNGIESHARKLVTEYAQVRDALEETETDRPILWICHDLGGTIVKQALSIALSEPAKYGKMALLTTAIVFLGTPHRFQSTLDMEDQLHKLIVLPGPEINNRVLSKVQNLGRQVKRINEQFLATKLLDRAAIFNIFSQNVKDSLRGTPAKQVADDESDVGEKDDEFNTVTPFPRYVHLAGHSFESYGRIRVQPIDHIDLAQGDPNEEWISAVTEILNTDGCLIKADYRIVKFQAYILSLSPPTRGLDTHFDPVLPRPPVVKWLSDHNSFKTFSKAGIGLRLLHLHGNGNEWINISSLSRSVFVHYNSYATVSRFKRAPQKTVVYFEFDKHDSRYRTIDSLLTYLINALVWNFWTGCVGNIIEELAFLEDTKSWSQDDLYHVFITLRDCIPAAQRLTIFISCFDQCPKEQRQWFLDRILEEQSYTETECRIIISTSTPDAVTGNHLPEGIRVDLNDCPEVAQSVVELPEELRLSLGALVEDRPVFDDVRPHLERMLKECTDAPYLGHILLTWLRHHLRGKPRSDMIEAIEKFSPVTAKRVIDVFISTLDSGRRQRATSVFNWIKYACEPLSPEALVEAIAVNECNGEEPSFEDLDLEGTIQDMEDTFCGVIIVQNRDVKFSHASFYDLPAMGIEGTAEECDARVHSTMATTCLRYFRFRSSQYDLLRNASKNLTDAIWSPLNVCMAYHPRTSMAEYAVRFWPHHYKAAGDFRPANLVRDLFADRDSRASWEIPFWLMSNPFTRMQQSYLSTLPIFAMLGLKDLVQERVQLDNGSPDFERYCWLAITEAIRSGYDEIALQLLEQVACTKDELSTALFWAASNGNSLMLDRLIEEIPSLNDFRWAEKLMQRAAASGLDNLVTTMLQAGCDVNETYGKTLLSPAGMAATRNRVSTMKILLRSENKPDLFLKSSDGDCPMTVALSKGNPDMMELLFHEGAMIDLGERMGAGFSVMGPVQVAVKWCRHKAVDILIKAGADFKTGLYGGGVGFFAEPPLIVAADQGLQQCVRLMLEHSAETNIDQSTGKALYHAVTENRLEVARLLLEHEPRPNMDAEPDGGEKLLTRAVMTGNIDIISLLVEHDVQIDFVDQNCTTFCKTPLSKACFEGDLDIVKLLVEKGADVNYTGDGSDAPLFTAFYENEVQVGKYLLGRDGIDVMWVGDDGMGILHAAFNHHDVLPELLARGVPIDGHGIYGTALQMAARDDFPKSIQVLLQSDPKPDLEYIYGEDGAVPEEIGFTSLQLACYNGAPSCVKVLLDAGANPEFKNKNGDDAVDILIKREKDPKGTAECLGLLLAKQHNVSLTQVDSLGKTRLHQIMPETPPSIVQILVEAKAPLDIPDEKGYTPLAVAISRRAIRVAEYLLSQGASPRTIGPEFGSILHIAVGVGAVRLVKLLLNAGADLETVHPDYGESLLHAALGIKHTPSLKKMVRYLVDEAKVPVDKRGGEFHYPIIRAAYLTRMNFWVGLKMLKFLIRRKAQLNVADGQGRRAVHLASAAFYDTGLRALVDAGADINVRDKFGRLPLHFAASSSFRDSLFYLLENFPSTDIEAKDYDEWTPLLWAARTGELDAVTKLVEHGADVWARGGSAHSRTKWSALKLINFANSPLHDHTETVVPKDLTRINSDGETEEWDEYFHKSKPGHAKDFSCDSCLVNIVGMQWKCIECKEDWSLCFKCAGNRAEMHNPQHSFEEVEPWYDEPPKSAPPSSRRSSVASKPGAPELPVEIAEGVEGHVNGVPNGSTGQDEPPDFDFGPAT